MGIFSSISNFITKPIASVAGSLLGLGGSLLGSKTASDVASDNVQYQKEFAQQGIRWRVADAKAAGINPLVALGASPVSYSPQSIGGTDYGLGALGQDLTRAISSMQTKEERAQAQVDRDHKVQMDWLDRQKSRKELGIMSLQELKLQRELQNQPGMPSTNVNQAGVLTGQNGVNNVPAERIISGTLGVQAGAQPMQQISVDSEGRIYFPIGKAVEESMENDWVEKHRFLGNRIKDTFWNVGRGLVDKVYNLPGYDRAVADKRAYIARELGVPVSMIHYNRYMDTYSVTPEGRRKINGR